MTELAGLFRDMTPTVELGWLGRAFVLVLLVGVPLIAVMQPSDRDLELPPRRALYYSAIVGVLALAGLTAVVLAIEGVRVGDVGLFVPDLGALLGWTVAVTVTAIVGNFAVTWLARRLGIRESRLTYHLLPRTGEERRLFIAVSLAAGVCEELAYHGFLLAALAAWVGNGWIAALVANAAFGVLHGYQGQAGVFRAGLMGYALSVPVIVGAGILPAMLSHFLVNVLLGLWLWRWLVPYPQALDNTDVPEDRGFF